MDINLLYSVSVYLQREDVSLDIRRAVNSAIASIAAADQVGDRAEVERQLIALRALGPMLSIHHRGRFRKLVDRADLPLSLITAEASD
jgi:hypothetical protein